MLSPPVPVLCAEAGRQHALTQMMANELTETLCQDLGLDFDLALIIPPVATVPGRSGMAVVLRTQRPGGFDQLGQGIGCEGGQTEAMTIA